MRLFQGDRDGGARLAIVVALLTMLGPFSIDTYLPSFPAIQQEFGVEMFQVQQTLSFYLWAFAATTLVWGPLSDAFGRRRVALWALGGYILFSIGCALAADIVTFTLMRIGQGLMVSVGIVVGRAAVRDSFDGTRARKVMANVMVLFALAPAIAPMVGGLLHEWFGWRSVFWFLALLGSAVWLMVLRALPETLAVEARRSPHPLAVAGQYRRTLGHPGFLGIVGIIALNFGGLFLYVAGAPFVLYDQLGLGSRDFPVLFVPIVAGVMCGAWLSGRLARRWSALRSAVTGLLVCAGGALLNLTQSLLLSPEPLHVVAPVALYALGSSLAMPGLVLLALEYFPDSRGTAAAVQSFGQVAFNGIVAGLLVPLLAISVAGFALGMVLLNLSALLLYLLWCRRGGAPRVGPA